MNRSRTGFNIASDGGIVEAKRSIGSMILLFCASVLKVFQRSTVSVRTFCVFRTSLKDNQEGKMFDTFYLRWP
jgi:hypothetical protein